MQPAVKSVPAEPTLTRSHRWISFLEVVLGACVVIGHNVFHVIPNEVPILFVLFWISPRIRGGKWSLQGLRRPNSWLKTVVMAMVAAVVLQLGSELLIQPLAGHFWHGQQHVSSVMKTSAHDWKFALRNLAIVWVFAGFGEELGYRGYLLTRAADLGNGSKFAYLAAMAYVAVLFGFGHFTKAQLALWIPPILA